MSTTKEIARKERTKKRKELLEKIKNAVNDENLGNYLDFLYDEGYFQNLTDKEMDCIASHVTDSGPGTWTIYLNAKDICVGIRRSENASLIGVDPFDCYQSVEESSILAYFPMTKREYKSFLFLFDKINGSDALTKKEWMKEAPEDFCGEYAVFGQ